jgi:hypothetical protein
LIAAPGMPKACVMPSYSITHTAAWAAVILAMACSFVLVGPTVGMPRRCRKAGGGHIIHSISE